MAAYDAFLVELFQYTGKDTLKDLSYEELSRATNKVCKQIYGAKPTEDQKKEQANIKRKVKMEWKKENETEEGLIKTSMYEEKAVTEEHVEALEGALRYSGSETDLKAEKAVEELREIVEQQQGAQHAQSEQEHKKEVADEDIKQDEDEQQGPAEDDHAYVLPARKPEDYKTIELELSFVEEENEMLKAHNLALKLAHQKLSGLIDGLCIGSSIVLGGLLAVLLVHKFL